MHHRTTRRREQRDARTEKIVGTHTHKKMNQVNVRLQVRHVKIVLDTTRSKHDQSLYYREERYESLRYTEGDIELTSPAT